MAYHDTGLSLQLRKELSGQDERTLPISPTCLTREKQLKIREYSKQSMGDSFPHYGWGIEATARSRRGTGTAQGGQGEGKGTRMEGRFRRAAGQEGWGDGGGGMGSLGGKGPGRREVRGLRGSMGSLGHGGHWERWGAARDGGWGSLEQQGE